MNILKGIEPLIEDVHSLIVPISTSDESDSTDTGDYRIKHYWVFFIWYPVFDRTCFQ